MFGSFEGKEKRKEISQKSDKIKLFLNK